MHEGLGTNPLFDFGDKQPWLPLRLRLRWLVFQPLARGFTWVLVLVAVTGRLGAGGVR